MNYYIVAIESYAGDTTRRAQFTGEPDTPRVVGSLYAILRIDEDNAEIVDDGYRTREEALGAWPEAK